MFSYKNTLKKIYLIVLSTILFIGSFSFVYAEDLKYVPLAPLPGTLVEGGNSSTLATYLPNLFKLFIGVGAVSAFVIITIYGLEIMLTDSLGTKMKAKEMLDGAMWGLGLVIFAYVILNTINPNLLKGDLNIVTPTINNPPVVEAGAGGGTGNAKTYTSNPDPAGDAVVRNQLTSTGKISINRTNPCGTTQTSGCTTLTDLPQTAISGLLSVTDACGCNIMVTAGTETLPHNGGVGTEHGPGQPVVDLSPSSSLNQLIGIADPGSQVQTVNGKLIGPTKTFQFNGRTATATYEVEGGNAAGSSTGNHWHVVFK